MLCKLFLLDCNCCSGWRGDLNYSARTKDGRVNIDALPASADNDYCAVLLLRANDSLAKENTDASQVRSLLDSALPMFSPLIDDATLKDVAAKPVSRLPSFRYVGPTLHMGNTLLIGDAVHTVKPYFGLGANSALEDVVKFGASLDAQAAAGVASVTGPGVLPAVAGFSQQRAGEAKALVQISREFDRPGAMGFLTFILPLILDGIFNRVAPKIFSPNTIAMLQRDGLSFREVRARCKTSVQSPSLVSACCCRANGRSGCRWAPCFTSLSAPAVEPRLRPN